MSRVPPPKTGSGSLRRCATRSRRVAVLVEAQVEDLGAATWRVADDALACRLMNRSALLLLATAARSSSPTVASPSRVSSTRTPSRAFERGLQPARDARA